MLPVVAEIPSDAEFPGKARLKMAKKKRIVESDDEDADPPVKETNGLKSDGTPSHKLARTVTGDDPPLQLD